VSSYLLGCNFILAAAKIADGSIPTNHNNVFDGKGAIQDESCSEQAFAHLFARHDDSRERQVAPLVSRSEEF
jgi:hypothetical protein